MLICKWLVIAVALFPAVLRAADAETDAAKRALEAIASDKQAVERVCAWQAEMTRLNRDGDLKRVAKIEALAKELPPAMGEAVRLINKHGQKSPETIIEMYQSYRRLLSKCPLID